MSRTFVKLPSGDIEIEHIESIYYELRATTFQFSPWKPRPALIEKSGKTTWLYTGQKFDSTLIDLVQEGWTHDHCQVCFINISNTENESTITTGYFNGCDWVCPSCYERIISADNITKTLQSFQKIQK